MQTRKIFGLRIAVLIISNKEMEDVIKTAKSLEDSSLLIKGFSEKTEKETKEKKVDFSACY